MMVESQELEKEKESVIVDSEETTELAQAEALLEDEVASAPDDDSATASEEAEAGASDVAGADGEESIEEEEPGEGEEKEPERPEGVAWFVVHSYSGYENKVEKNLEHRIESMGMQDQIFQVVVPTEEEVELRDGQRRTTERRVFPGYILVEMLMNDDTWYVVRNTPGVTDFVRSGTKPIPLRQEEVDKILKRMEAEAPKIKVRFKEGQKVRIVDGPFEDFMGTVDAIDTDRARVRVLVNMFGRETPVEVDFLQVERV
jgi:transcriptional antiterminator NusG